SAQSQLARLGDGRLTRRQALARAGALGLSVSAGAGMLPGVLASQGAAAQDTPARSGGRLVASISQSPSSLDPAFGINSAEFSVTSWVYDNLVWLGPDLILQPMLA